MNSTEWSISSETLHFGFGLDGAYHRSRVCARMRRCRVCRDDEGMGVPVMRPVDPMKVILFYVALGPAALYAAAVLNVCLKILAI